MTQDTTINGSQRRRPFENKPLITKTDVALLAGGLIIGSALLAVGILALPQLGILGGIGTIGVGLLIGSGALAMLVPFILSLMAKTKQGKKFASDLTFIFKDNIEYSKDRFDHNVMKSRRSLLVRILRESRRIITLSKWISNTDNMFDVNNTLPPEIVTTYLSGDEEDLSDSEDLSSTEWDFTDETWASYTPRQD